jgi:hypothetical protein
MENLSKQWKIYIQSKFMENIDVKTANDFPLHINFKLFHKQEWKEENYSKSLKFLWDFQCRDGTKQKYRYKLKYFYVFDKWIKIKEN